MMNNAKVSVLFGIFDKKFDILDGIIYNSILHHRPLYMIEDKLATVEDGKEIITDRTLTKNSLRYISTLEF